MRTDIDLLDYIAAVDEVVQRWPAIAESYVRYGDWDCAMALIGHDLAFFDGARWAVRRIREGQKRGRSLRVSLDQIERWR